MRLERSSIPTLLDTISELTRERDEARSEAAGYLSQLQEDPLAKQLAIAEAAVAVAYREATEHYSIGRHGRIVCNCGVILAENYGPGGRDALKNHILSLTPSAAIRAEKRLVAQAKVDQVAALLAEVEQEIVKQEKAYPNSQKNPFVSGRLHGLKRVRYVITAALAAIEKETKDADV